MVINAVERFLLHSDWHWSDHYRS